VYLLQREVHAGRTAETAQLRVWSILFNFLLCLSVLHADPGNFPVPILLTGLAMTGVGYAAALARLRHTLSRRALADTCAIEVLSLALLALSFRVPISITHYVAYHVLFWALYPVPKLLRTGQALPFAGWHAVVIPALWLCSPWGPLHMSVAAWNLLFFTATYVHVSSSFALSSAQPAWLNRLFRVSIPGVPPRRPAAAAALVRPVAVLDE
jgi:hypothetical protein